MSRPTDFQMTKASNLAPNPNRYDPKVTNSGDTYLAGGTSISDQVRGTFSKNDRFKEYKHNAYVRSNPNVGPGSHADQENFES